MSAPTSPLGRVHPDRTPLTWRRPVRLIGTDVRWEGEATCSSPLWMCACGRGLGLAISKSRAAFAPRAQLRVALGLRTLWDHGHGPCGRDRISTSASTFGLRREFRVVSGVVGATDVEIATRFRGTAPPSRWDAKLASDGEGGSRFRNRRASAAAPAHEGGSGRRMRLVISKSPIPPRSGCRGAPPAQGARVGPGAGAARRARPHHRRRAVLGQGLGAVGVGSAGRIPPDGCPPVGQPTLTVQVAPSAAPQDSDRTVSSS